MGGRENVLQCLLSLPDEAIFAIIDDFSKVAYISYTNNLKARIGLIAAEISSDTFKVKFGKENTEIRILETVSERVFVKYYIDDYRNKGYTVHEERLPVLYKFRVELSIEGVMVIAVTKGNSKIVLGEFSNKEEAEEFLQYINRNNKAINLVYKI